jgi:hypothetical protein
MSLNSLNIKGLQHGKSPEAQCFPSQIVNNKNPKRELDNNTMVSFNMGHLSKGVYFVRVILDNNTIENHKINLID